MVTLVSSVNSLGLATNCRANPRPNKHPNAIMMMIFLLMLMIIMYKNWIDVINVNISDTKLQPNEKPLVSFVHVCLCPTKNQPHQSSNNPRTLLFE